MIVKHQGVVPKVDPSAYVAPTAVLCGDVEVGAGARILFGAVLTGEGAPVRVGKNCVVMEYAVVRASGGRQRQFPVTLGDNVVVGPHAHLVGCTIEPGVILEAQAEVQNGAVVQREAVVMQAGMVMAKARVPARIWIPPKHIALGDPLQIYAPSVGEAVLAEWNKLNFNEYVFGLKVDEPLAPLYAHALGKHRQDEVIEAVA